MGVSSTSLFLSFTVSVKPKLFLDEANTSEFAANKPRPVEFGQRLTLTSIWKTVTPPQ